jgi:hypothetical protein
MTSCRGEGGVDNYIYGEGEREEVGSDRIHVIFFKVTIFHF